MPARAAPTIPKLLKLQSWLSLADAARYLQLSFGEDVSEADVLRLALDDRLRLSVRFVNKAHAMREPALTPEQKRQMAEWYRDVGNWRPGTPAPTRPSQVEHYDERISVLDNNTVYDLPMAGAERLDVQDRYEKLTGGPPVLLIDLEGPLVETTDGTRWQIQELLPDKIETGNGPVETGGGWMPAPGLPPDAVIVVRQAVLKEFVESQTQREPLGKREREKLLAIIAGLCAIAGIGLQSPSKEAMKIADAASKQGLEIAPRTIEGHLNAVSELLRAHR